MDVMSTPVVEKKIKKNENMSSSSHFWKTGKSGYPTTTRIT